MLNIKIFLCRCRNLLLFKKLPGRASLCLTGVLLSALAIDGVAQTTPSVSPLSLDTILSRIERNNPGLQVYQSNINALNTYAEGARSWSAPQVGAGLFMTPYNFSKPKDASMQRMGSVMISIEQMIPNPQKQRAKENYLLGKSTVERENQDYLRNQLFAQAKSEYYEWLILKKKQNVLEKSEDLMNFIIKVSELRFPYEQEKLSSIYKAKASLYELQNKQLMLSNQIRQRNIALNTLLDQEANIVFDIDTNQVITDFEEILLDTLSLQAQRSDIRALEQSIQQAKLNQALELSERRPDFGIRYDHMNTFGEPNQFSLMGMITIPIAPWASKGYKANVKAIGYEINALEKQKEAIINEVLGSIQTMASEYATLKRQLELYEKSIIPALRSSYKTSLLAYEQNTEDLFVVLDAWDALQMTQLEYLDKLAELLKIQVEYEREIEKR